MCEKKHSHISFCLTQQKPTCENIFEMGSKYAPKLREIYFIILEESKESKHSSHTISLSITKYLTNS